jgi:hypothetical protein
VSATNSCWYSSPTGHHFEGAAGGKGNRADDEVDPLKQAPDVAVGGVEHLPSREHECTEGMLDQHQIGRVHLSLGDDLEMTGLFPAEDLDL